MEYWIGPQSRSPRCGRREKQKSSLLPAIEARFHGHPTRGLVNILAEETLPLLLELFVIITMIMLRFEGHSELFCC
jgi:hypothetical protein